MKLTRVICVLIALGSAPASANAQSVSTRLETEAEVLARLVAELDALTLIIDKAQSRADRTERHFFDYGLLRHEVSAVKTGVQEYLGGVRQQPRDAASLKATYSVTRREPAQ